MVILLIGLGTASIVLLFLLILQKREIKNISIQINEIKFKDTNELVHTLGGEQTCMELINEINSLLHIMRDIKIDYRQKNHALEQMMMNISHDLRTPLTSAMGYINIIKSCNLPQEEKEREIEIIEKRLIRLEELLNSFFEFSKIISSDKPPETEKLKPVALLEEAIAHYFDDYCGQDREITFRHSQTKQTIRSNRNMLIRIFDNLIGNALKHGTGDLSISLEESDCVLIRFENELVNSDIDVERVFDEFYTTDISRTKGNTGLGLAIAKQFTQMLGGNIYAEYDGIFFSVTVEFPINTKN